MFMSNDKKFLVLPELHVNHALKKQLLYEFSVTPRNINPSIGINFVNLIHLKLGYSVPILAQEDLRGLSFGVNFFIGKNNFYDYIKLGF